MALLQRFSCRSEAFVRIQIAPLPWLQPGHRNVADALALHRRHLQPDLLAHPFDLSRLRIFFSAKRSCVSFCQLT